VSKQVSYALIAAAIFLMLAGANLPTPLYELYRTRFALTPFAITAIYAIYALIVIFGLPAFGAISDNYGRRAALNYWLDHGIDRGGSLRLCG
jgi:MFS family permease